MKTQGRKIIEKVKMETNRGPVSFYLSMPLLKEFRKACDGAPASRVLESLMVSFVESTVPKKTRVA